MKKRLLSCVLAGAMIVAMLAGCGGNSAEENAVQQRSEEASGSRRNRFCTR